MTKILRPESVAPTIEPATDAEVQDFIAHLAVFIENNGQTPELVANRAESVSYLAPKRNAVVSYLMTGGLGGTYYASKQQITQEARDLFKEFARGGDEDVSFFARAIVYAREHGFMRTMPITALVYLTTGEKRAKLLAERFFDRVVLTTGDLQDVVLLCRPKHGQQQEQPKKTTLRSPYKTPDVTPAPANMTAIRGMGRLMHRLVNKWLHNHLTDHQVIKYGSESQQMSLRDIYRIARPLFKDDTEAGVLAHYAVKGTLPAETYTYAGQIAGYLQFKQAEDTLDNLLKMVEAHRLPWEVVTSQLQGTTAGERKRIWQAMARQMPYMALLRNVNNLLKHDAFSGEEGNLLWLDMIEKITKPENVRHSKQFPFRFLNAYRTVEQSGHSSMMLRTGILSALDTALDTSCENMPYLGERVFIANDVSGSMNSAVNSGEHTTWQTRAGQDLTCADVASIFAAAIARRSAMPTIVSFDTQTYLRQFNKIDSVRTIAGQITAHGGGTALHMPIAYACNTGGKAFDALVFLTDNESWVGEMSRNGSQSKANVDKYLALHPESHFFFVQLVPTQTQMVLESANVHYIYGWSPDVLNFIGQIMHGKQQLDAIAQVTI